MGEEGRALEAVVGMEGMETEKTVRDVEWWARTDVLESAHPKRPPWD